VQPGGPGQAFTFATPTVLLDISRYGIGLIGRGFDIAPDDQRFLMRSPVAPDSAVVSLTVVAHWIEELKGRVKAR
jgi:hypothetical protein